LTPLPPQLLKKAAIGKTFVVWRLERTEHFPTWAAGIGAEKVGGRWNPKGRAVIYASIDPATTILEAAVHKGFETLDVVPHKLVGIEILAPAKVHVVRPADVPNKRWLMSGSISGGQQKFGADLLDRHPLVMLPSVVSPPSWNLVIDVASAKGLFKLFSEEDFALDTRFNPPPP
jgi:RES domain-containing protein